MVLNNSFFNPKTIAVLGASDDPTKLGSMIVKNLQDIKYQGKIYGVNVKIDNQTINGVPFVNSILKIQEQIDLVVVVIGAKFCSQTIDECIEKKVPNVSIIAAGFSEIGNHELEEEITKKCLDNGINLLGPNCLGHISTFDNLNASFADGSPEKGNVAFISQSGAYCSAILDWARNKGIGFSHFISIGNKAVLDESDLLDYLQNDKNTSAFVFYLESLKNGTKFLNTLKKVAKTKPVVILEPGKSAKAQAASLSHTGSLAPNSKVLEIALQKSGAIQVFSTRKMFSLLEVLQFANHKDFSGKIAILTNAGGVGVLTSDLCEEECLEMAKPSDATITKLKEVLPEMAAFGNPIDVVGDAGADRYENSLKILCESGEYKNILVLLTPQSATKPLETAESIIKIAKSFKNVNIFTSFVGGTRIEEAKKLLEKEHIVNFDYPVDATRLLGKLKKHSEFTNLATPEIKISAVPENIKTAIKKAKDEGLASLPQDAVNLIMEHYKIDYPKSANFTDKASAFEFCKTIFPNPVVLKLSAPDALHKTEMKGIYLNVDSETKFNEGFDGLMDSINKFSLKGASVLIQEMITKSTETIIGVNTDNNFGKVMVFGTGGIYTEIWKDTTLRILPASDFDDMIKETKIGTILNGVRGEEPKAVSKVIDTLKAIQQLVLEIPEITSIDVNPALITKERAIVVDFKILLK